MSDDDQWSPDGALGTETFAQGDEALDEAARTNPAVVEALGQDPSLDPSLQADDRELHELGAELDDPEDLVTLDGGIDDPDGLGGPTGRSVARSEDREGWDLDAPSTSQAVPEDVLDSLPHQTPPD